MSFRENMMRETRGLGDLLVGIRATEPRAQGHFLQEACLPSSAF